jgi:hypothetical protein
VSGVPMVCWLLYSEQSINKVHVVELGLREGECKEVEAKVRMVMESEEGKMLRERLVMAKAMAVDALNGGGSLSINRVVVSPLGLIRHRSTCCFFSASKSVDSDNFSSAFSTCSEQ